MDPSKLHPLLDNADVRRLLSLLRSEGIEGRLVGGCVRDALLGIPCADIDLAVDQPPEVVQAALENAGMRVIPTGIKHGTVTVLFGKRGIELTTLRRDLVTDGRHAEVQFTSRWEEDAARRDFTINALYCDIHGKIYDYFSGIEDLKSKTVRFIGDPVQRIQEDYLRILRYYRFQMRFGGALHVPSHQAILGQVGQLPRLSKERIQAELFKMLAYPTPSELLGLMQDDGVFKVLFGEPADLPALKTFCNAQEELSPFFQENLEISFELGRLWALFPHESRFFQTSLRLSRHEQHVVTVLFQERQRPPTEQNLFWMRCFHGNSLAGLWLLTQAIHSVSSLKELARAFQTPMPSFPLKGADLLAEGFAPGPTLGTILKECQSAWAESLGALSKDECLELCQQLSKQ